MPTISIPPAPLLAYLTQQRILTFSGGVMTDTGILAPGGLSINSASINDSGTIVGTDRGTNRAFSYSGGVETDLGQLGTSGSDALDINNLGVIVGDSFVVGGGAF